jgi:hypothetical protein
MHCTMQSWRTLYDNSFVEQVQSVMTEMARTRALVQEKEGI